MPAQHFDEQCFFVHRSGCNHDARELRSGREIFAARLPDEAGVEPPHLRAVIIRHHGHGGSFPNINSTAIATTVIVTPAMPIGNRENGRLDHTGRGSNEGGGGRLSVTTISADDTSALMDSAAGSQTERS